MHLCEKELQKLINSYDVRLKGLDRHLSELSLKGKSDTINYKINLKFSILLNHTIKDLHEITEKINHENRYKNDPARHPEK